MADVAFCLAFMLLGPCRLPLLAYRGVARS